MTTRQTELTLLVEGQEGVSWDQWVALAFKCEEVGLPALYSSDHYLAVDDLKRSSLDAWGRICALAAITSKLRLGTVVSPLTFRHPVNLAKIVVTADHISQGRIELGLGTGSLEHEHHRLGIPFGDLRTRFDQLEEQLRILEGLWADDGPFSFEGRFWQIVGVDAKPKPVRGRIPITLGGEAKPRSASLAARFADKYNVGPVTPAELRERRAVLNLACDTIGRDPRTLRVSVMTTVAVGRDDDEAEARIRQTSERLPLLETWRDRWAAGVVDQVAERILALGEAGADEVVLQMLTHDDLDHVELIGRALIPAVSGR